MVSINYNTEWHVPYEQGMLKAVGKRGGEVVCRQEVHTAGPPARVTLEPDRGIIKADGHDLSYVTARIVNKDSHTCPNAGDLIEFTLEGDGSIAGIGNGDPTNHEPFDGAKHQAVHGLGLAVVKSGNRPDALRLTATAKGIEASMITITAK